MQVTINLPDDQASALQALALARGLSLEKWFERLAAQEAESPYAPARASLERVLELQRRSESSPEVLTINDYVNRHRR